MDLTHQQKWSTDLDTSLGHSDLEDEKLKQRLRAIRFALLPEEDRGLIYWEDWCEENGWDRVPTWEKVAQFAEEVVAPMEDKVNSLSLLDSSIRPINGTRAFILPIFRLQRLIRHRLATDGIHHKSEPTSREAPVMGSMKSIEIPMVMPPTKSNPENLVPEKQLPTTQPHTLSATSSVLAFTDGLGTTRKPNHKPSHQRLRMTDPELDHAGDCQENPVAQPSTGLSHEKVSSEQKTVVQSGVPSVASKLVPSEVVEMPCEPKYQKRNDQDYADADTNTGSAECYTHFDPEMMHTLSLCRRGAVDPARVTKQYLSTKVMTVHDVLQEWLFGIHGGPAVQHLNNKYHIHWRAESDRSRYQKRSGIVKEYKRLVLKEKLSEKGAIETLERLRSSGSLSTLYSAILARRERKPAKRQASDTPNPEILLKRPRGEGNDHSQSDV